MALKIAKNLSLKHKNLLKQLSVFEQRHSILFTPKHTPLSLTHQKLYLKSSLITLKSC